MEALIASFFIKAVVNYLKPLWEKNVYGAKISLFVSLGLGILVCTMAGIDMFAQAGITLAVPYIGSVLSGVAAGGGANVIHDISEGIRSMGKNKGSGTGS